MSIEYVPSWWERFAPQINQGVSGIANGLLHRFAPDAMAQQTFQQLAQQNPDLTEQISNMDDGQREVYAKKVLGARNKDPFKNIGIGSKRKAREDEAAAIATLTPEQAAIRNANRLGTKTPEQIAQDKIDDERKGILFDQGQQLFPTQLEGAKIDLKGKKQRVDADGLALEEATRQSEAWKKTLKSLPTLDGIDIIKMADNLVHKKQVDPTQYDRVANDPKYGSILDTYVKAEEARIERAARFDLTQLRTPAEKSSGLTIVEKQADNARDALRIAETELSKIPITMSITQPQEYQAAKDRVTSAKKDYDNLSSQLVDYTNKVYGTDIKSPEDYKALNLARMIIDGSDPNAKLENIKDPILLEKVKKILAKSSEQPKPAVNKTSPFGSGLNPLLKR